MNGSGNGLEFFQILMFGFRISGARLKELSMQIANFFPCENPNTYYTPYSKIGKRRINPSGTLWEHYNYLKLKYRKRTILQPINRENDAGEVAPYILNRKSCCTNSS